MKLGEIENEREQNLRLRAEQFNQQTRDPCQGVVANLAHGIYQANRREVTCTQAAGPPELGSGGLSPQFDQSGWLPNRRGAFSDILAAAIFSAHAFSKLNAEVSNRPWIFFGEFVERFSVLFFFFELLRRDSKSRVQNVLKNL
jgi:hypothetical protein